MLESLKIHKMYYIFLGNLEHFKNFLKSNYSFFELCLYSLSQWSSCIQSVSPFSILEASSDTFSNVSNSSSSHFSRSPILMPATLLDCEFFKSANSFSTAFFMSLTSFAQSNQLLYKPFAGVFEENFECKNLNFDP